MDDYTVAETALISFNTFTSDDPSISCTVTNLVAGDVKVHKDGGLTQRASSSGITVNINFDGITGNHLITLQLSDDSDAGFYANGSRYQVRLEGITVDAGELNVWIGSFSIGFIAAALATYDPPTKGEMDTLIGALPTAVENRIEMDVNSTALATYDPPTKGEMDTGHGLLATEAKQDLVSASTTAILADTDALPTLAEFIAGIADGSYDLQEMIRIMFAALSGKSSGGGTTNIKFRDSADGKDRIDATVDSDGNRTAATLDGS